MTVRAEHDVLRILGRKQGADFKYYKSSTIQRTGESMKPAAEPAVGSAAALFSLLGDALPESAGIAVVGGTGAPPTTVATIVPVVSQPAPTGGPAPVASHTSADSAPVAATQAPPTQVAPIAAAHPEFNGTPAGLFPPRMPTRQTATGAQHSLGEMFRILTGRAQPPDAVGPVSSFPFRRR